MILPKRLSLHLTAVGLLGLLYGAPQIALVTGFLFGYGIVSLGLYRLFVGKLTDAS